MVVHRFPEKKTSVIQNNHRVVFVSALSLGQVSQTEKLNVQMYVAVHRHKKVCFCMEKSHLKVNWMGVNNQAKEIEQAFMERIMIKFSLQLQARV